MPKVSWWMEGTRSAYWPLNWYTRCRKKWRCILPVRKMSPFCTAVFCFFHGYFCVQYIYFSYSFSVQVLYCRLSILFCLLVIILSHVMLHWACYLYLIWIWNICFVLVNVEFIENWLTMFDLCWWKFTPRDKMKRRLLFGLLSEVSIRLMLLIVFL